MCNSKIMTATHKQNSTNTITKAWQIYSPCPVITAIPRMESKSLKQTNKLMLENFCLSLLHIIHEINYTQVNGTFHQPMCIVLFVS